MINYKNKIIDYANFLCKKNNIERTNVSDKKILDHVYKSDQIILVVIFIFLTALDFFTLLFFFSFFSTLKHSSRIKILRLFKPLNFAINKINDFILIIISFHQFGDETVDNLPIPKKNQEYRNELEFVVVGSGPSGSVVANELNKHFRGNVTIIEKGDNYSIPKSKHPGEEFSNKWFRGGLNSTYFREMVAFSSASCFGGGSEINSGLYHEPDESFFNNWKNEFNTSFFEFKKNIQYIEKVRTLANYQAINDNIFYKKILDNTNKDNQEFSILKKFISTNNNKNSMTRTLLAEFLNNDGKILLNTSVDKIKFIDNQWRLELKSNSKKSFIYTKNLFLCCGSIFTNMLLLKSNISNDKKQILKKFSFHPMIKAAALYDENVQNLNEDVISLQNMKYYPKFIFGNATSSLQFILSSFYSNKKMGEFIKLNWKKMKIFHATFSLGVGKIVMVPFLKYPILSYYLTVSEKNKMVTGYRELIKFIKKAGAKKFLPIGSNPNQNFFDYSNDDDYIGNLNSIKSLQVSSVHILGGVTMGESSKCVADSFGKIKSCNNLYVADSSLINTKLLKNPQGTVMMLAYRNIDYFIKNYLKKNNIPT